MRIISDNWIEMGSVFSGQIITKLPVEESLKKENK
jgi:hypothetical protein